MKGNVLLNFVVLLFLLAGCSKEGQHQKSASGILKTENGFIVNLPESNAVKRVRLEVINDNIIRVTSSATDSFSTAESLMVLAEKRKHSEWSLAENGNEVVLSTPALKAKVVTGTGEVIFTDSDGKILLQEQKGGGKSFLSKKVGDSNAYSVRQIFESPADEAFYGLGGHQNGQLNYKGEDVELVQHNIVDVVPFLYSSKNYGILWDNYSISKFGDPRDYLSLNSLTLFDKTGKQGGLTATYFVRNKIWKDAIEDKIEYEFLETPQVDSFPKDVAQNGKVVWEGSFSSDLEGAHKFLLYSSGYFKVWVDNTLIIDKWRQNWNPWTNKFNVDVKKGEKHTLRMEWIPDGGTYFCLKHLDPIPLAEQSKLSLWSEVADEIDYYFINGKNADEVIRGYRELTGKAPIVPKWALGYWQSRERYNNQKEIVDVVKEYRKRKIPIDNIVLDWRYWEDPKWGSHEFDKSRFPDPQGMINELHQELHTNLMISVWPKFNKGTENFDEMNKKGFLFIKNVQPKRKDWVGQGYESTFYDPFNAEAGKLFWNQIDVKLNALGVDAWWLDATEPDIHSNLSIDARKENMSVTALGPGEKYFNAYSLLNSKSVYEGQRQSSPEKRVFILTRSAYAGQQRYGATTWSGDIVSRWSDFQDQISTGINFSLSGIPYWTMDIGGFSVENRYYNMTGETQVEWRELNTRWFQFGAFCPIFRSHGQFPYREIYNIAPEGTKEYASMVFYTKLRYRLMPYLYSLAGQSFLNDYTIMRGLVMDFNHDAKAREVADQYMFGPSIMVAPVYEYKARQREVYFPSQTMWYDFYSGKKYEGGKSVTLDAPLETLPLFVKAGSIIPAGPQIQFTGEKVADPITLYIFPGMDASFTLYEDENTNYNYEKGQYSTIVISYDEATRAVTIGDRQGSFPGMAESRRFELVWVDDHQDGVGLTARPQQVIQYSGAQVKISQKPNK
jgi:alpha-D-xyloside xylohydrolase